MEMKKKSWEELLKVDPSSDPGEGVVGGGGCILPC